MDVFDNCRICLCGINHEPIKMTRLILKFLEECLQLTYVTKTNPYGKIKQNLCAPCFNRISEFQDFLEQCKDSDMFWKIQFNDLKKCCFEKQLTLEQSALFPLAEDSNSLEADTTVTTTDVIESKYTDHEDKNDILPSTIRIEHNKEEQNIIAVSSQLIEEEYETKQIKDFTCIDLTNWQNVTTDDNYSQTAASAECENDEMIEYEYQIEENELVEIEENPTHDESASADGCGVDYHSFAYEKIEVENSNGNVINEIIEDSAEAEGENVQNSFLLTSTTDKNGKVKMSYKCQHCGKSFNRIYDIESHYNIHKGVKPFTCNVCGKSFRQKNILTTHQALHFGKKVECAECGKKFARRSQLILHYRMHRDEKPFVCNFDGCQAAFRQRKQLIDHSFIHTGEKNFQCATCTKSFHTRKRLQDHIYKVHSQHRYRCELCEKAFLKPHMLKHHMITTHNVEVGDVSHLKTLVDILKPTKNKSRQVSRN